MKKNIIISILIFIIFIMSSSSFAQQKKVMVIRSAPSFTLQLNLNYDQAMGQLAGTFNNDFRSEQFMTGRTLGSDKGFGVNLIGKISLDNSSHLRLNISAKYNKLVSYLFGKSSTLADRGESKFNIFTGGMGLENNFTPNHKVKLYLGGEVLFSSLSGNATLWVENKPYTAYTYDVKIKPSFRIGAGLFAGAEYLVSESFGLNLGFNLSHLNLFFKQANDYTDSTEISLIDDENVNNPTSLYEGKKQLVYYSINAGVVFYWGISQKRYVIKK
jgi:hypothetical protein